VRLFVRSPLDAAAIMPRIVEAIHAADPDEPVTDIHSAEEEHARGYWFVGYFAAFYTAFGAFALLLAVIGVYGVVSQSVSERTREFGIRVALGASRRRLYRVILGRTLALAVVGIALGLAGARLTTHLLGAILFGANPNDPAVLAFVGSVLIVVMLAASYLPARRAARIDPVQTLRAE
jgi:ABC-type antimicrobial peptide transport system permease subunit